MTRQNRILLQLLVPPPLGALLSMLFILVFNTLDQRSTSGSELVEWIFVLGIAMLFSYFAIGIQTIICTLLMEWRFSRGLNPASWPAVGFSTLLGGIAGISIILQTLVFLGFVGFVESMGFVLLGVTVGFLIGLAIRKLSLPKPEPNRS